MKTIRRGTAYEKYMTNQVVAPVSCYRGIYSIILRISRGERDGNCWGKKLRSKKNRFWGYQIVGNFINSCFVKMYRGSANKLYTMQCMLHYFGKVKESLREYTIFIIYI